VGDDNARTLNLALLLGHPVHNTMVNPVVVFGSETRAMTEMDMKRLGTWERKISEIHVPVVEQGIW